MHTLRYNDDSSTSSDSSMASTNLTSVRDSPPDDIGTHSGPKKPKTVRRHGACEPCRTSKTRCDGAKPCGACRSEKRKSRTCYYSKKALGIAAAREESALRKRKARRGSTSADSDDFDTYLYDDALQPSCSNGRDRVEHVCKSSGFVHIPIALKRVVEEFVSVKPPKGLTLQCVNGACSKWRQLEVLTQGRPKRGPITDVPTDRHKIHTIRDNSLSNQLKTWEGTLTHIHECINRGELNDAWTMTGWLTRSIESSDVLFQASIDGVVDDFHRLDSLCLKLLDIDCLFGFLIGSNCAWIKSKFVRSRIERWREQDEGEEKVINNKIDLYMGVYDLLSVDTSTEAGMWDFLHHIQAVKKASPATPLERMATCITKDESAEKQVLKLISNLAFMVSYCKIASVCGHYATQDCPVPPPGSGHSDIIHTLKLTQPRQKGQECHQAIKHAGNAVEAFVALCEMDAHRVANDWFLLHGALTAAVLIGINSFREKATDRERIGERMHDLQRKIAELRPYNPKCPIFDLAFEILLECDTEKLKTKKTKAQSQTCRFDDSDDSDASAEPSSESSPENTFAKPNINATIGRKRNIEKVMGDMATTNFKTKKVAMAKLNEADSSRPSSFGGHQHQLRDPTSELPIGTPSVQLAQSVSVDPLANTSFTSTTTFHEELGTQAPTLQSNYNFYTLGGEPWVQPIPVSYEPIRPPQMLETNHYQTIHDRNGRFFSVPNEFAISNFSHPAHFGHAHLQGSDENMPIPTPYALTSPQHAHSEFTFRNTNSGIEPFNAVSEAEGTNFFNMTSRNFEANRTRDMDSVNPPSRPNAMPRRHSEQDLQLATGSIMQTWHSVQNPSTSHDRNQPVLAPPRTEPIFHDHESYASSTHQSYYRFNNNDNRALYSSGSYIPGHEGHIVYDNSHTYGASYHFTDSTNP